MPASQAKQPLNKKEQYKHLELPLAGKLRLDSDPALLAVGDFQKLINMRYFAFSPKGIQGMTAINDDSLVYNKVINGFNFKKDVPVENHVISQISSGSISKLVIDDGSSDVPSVMDFIDFQILPTTNTVRFFNAPDGCMVALDGNTNYIWGGDEYRTASFAIYDDATNTFWYDFTTQVNNTLKDSENIAPFSGTGTIVVDSNTLLLLHLDGGVTDSSPTAKTVANHSVTFDGTDKVFGADSGVWASTGSEYLSLAAGLIDLSGGIWTIDFRFKCASLSAIQTIFYQKTQHFIYYINWTAFGLAPLNVNDSVIDYTMLVSHVATVLFTQIDGIDESGNYYGHAYIDCPNNNWETGTGIYAKIYQKSPIDGLYHLFGTQIINSNAEYDDSIEIFIDTSGNINLILNTANYGFGSETVDLTFATTDAPISTGTWYFIEVVENGNNFYIFTGASTTGNTALHASASTGARLKQYLGETWIGRNFTLYSDMHIDEMRISNIARHTAISAVTATAYGAASQATVYVSLGSTRPIQGATFYILSSNNHAATASVKYWDGGAWVTALNIVDSTSDTGRTLYKNGKISFDSTAGTCKQSFVHGQVGFFYKFIFTGVDTSTVLYYVTVDTPIQPIVDIWDGSPRNCLEFFVYKTNYADFTPFISSANYVAGDSTTFAQVGALTGSQYIYLGFSQRMMGLQLAIPDPTYVNSNGTVGSPCTLEIDYWNGSAWVSVGTLVDTTLDATGYQSFNHTGTITWNPPDASLEFKKQIANNNSYYYYRLNFANTISTDVRVDWCTGIPATDIIYAYKVPLLWMNRLWLFNNINQGKNAGVFSSSDSVSIWNGNDSGLIFFGDDSEIVAAETMFSRFGGTLYDNAILFKRRAVFMIDGLTPTEWVQKVYCVSDNIGCVAPLTVQKCDVAYDVATGITKHVIIFQSARGIEVFDGNAVFPISEDIKCFFDPSDSRHINTDMVESFFAFYDEKYFEYHWLFCTGTDTVINKEMVYDLRKKKWYEIQRGIGKQLLSGWKVLDEYGERYVYGGTNDGYIERLEYGTTFDGNDMVFTFRTGDMSLAQTISYMTDVRHITVMGVSKNTTQNRVTLNYYLDGSNSPTGTVSWTQANSKRIYMARRSINACAVLQSFECITTTNDETIGFEPLMLSVLMRVDREHVSATQK